MTKQQDAEAPTGSVVMTQSWHVKGWEVSKKGKDRKQESTRETEALESTEVGYRPFTQNALIFTTAALGSTSADRPASIKGIIAVSTVDSVRSMGTPQSSLLRQQLRTQAPGAKANAFWSVGLQMARNEGAMSLMNSLTASMLRELTYSGIHVGTYKYFKSSIHGLAPGTLATDGHTLKVLAASVAATLGIRRRESDKASFFFGAGLNRTVPRRRWQQSACRRTTPAGSPYRSTRRALYRGTDATTLRGVVLSVSQICAYDQLKQSLKRRDVVKVRVMNDKEHKFGNEGPMAFYKVQHVLGKGTFYPFAFKELEP
ncbi:hypothetical protein EDB85DRAFT_2279892 [Lactarius pseudohatsudake]|nr:hypothetical protein EDB85DRAFT_2279892 [Lactarius pseudohatsudake]